MGINHHKVGETKHQMLNYSREYVVNNFLDCPHCGSEFVISDDLLVSTVRCPDCLMWIDEDVESVRSELAGYASRLGSDYLDDLEMGYDY